MTHPLDSYDPDPIKALVKACESVVDTNFITDAEKIAIQTANETKSEVDAMVSAKGLSSLTYVRNGFGQDSNNNNFPDFTFDPSDSPVGTGSFKRTITGDGADFKSTEDSIPIIPTEKYKMKLAFKTKGKTSETVALYVGFSELDADGQIVNPWMFHSFNGSATTLTRPLSIGDTSIFVADASAFSHAQSGTYVLLGDYIAPTGREYSGAYGYSRWWSTRASVTNIGGGEWEIVLNGPWGVANPNNGGVFPIGHPVRPPAHIAGSYKYIVTSGDFQEPDDMWIFIEGLCEGKNSDPFTVRNNMFYSVTAFVRPIFGTITNTFQSNFESKIAGVTFGV